MTAQLEAWAIIAAILLAAWTVEAAIEAWRGRGLH